MRARGRGERGGITVLVALISVSALVMVGLVLDGGQLRLDRRVSKGVTDMAARAGVSRLPFGPWSGVCKARQFLLSNAKGFSSFDVGSETWSTAAGAVIGSDPCPAVAVNADAVACAPNAPATWAKLQATAAGGRFTIEIQSGYALPDARFPTDTGLGDAGATDMGSCDNLAVILTERQESRFAQVNGPASTNVRVRSVGRLNATQTLDFVAALQLLERNKCDVLQVGGNGTRVIAQPYNTYPGTIQIDSAGDTGSCPSPILNSQATSGGPAVLACSVNSANPDCRPGVGDRPSRVGIYAINFNRPESIISTGYPTTYGDSKAVASPRTGRKFTDLRYRQNVYALDQDVKNLLIGNAGLPPGCASVNLLSTCTGNGITWLVVQDCSALGTFFNAVLGRTAMQHIWFKCDLNVTTPLTLSAADSYIVVTGKLAVNSTLTITDPRKVFIGGEPGGNKIGLDLTGSGTLNMNTGGASACSNRTEPGHANRLVIGNGAMKVASGFTARICQTFIYLASGFNKVPATDGTLPCTSPCSTYAGTIEVTAGANVDLSAPNEITGRLPEAAELLTTNPFEDLGLWVEAGGATNGLTGGAATKLRGVFFLPNADPFTLAGGGSLPIDLSAQFVSTSLKVQGGATVNLVPNPEDSIPVTIYTVLLVR